ncbi:MAG: DUF899 domain-containing protein [Chlorobia bacterium]|nr:DUF899 domain-containing protein [Fimbriimonadaceae bacterium]
MNERVVSRDEWVSERQKLLVKEKEMTRLRDQLNEQRLALPWVKVDKKYVFEEGDGLVALADLFGKRSQLAVYHFMFAPEWEAGCPGCSFLCDHVDSARQHFEHNDLSFVAVSRAAWPKLEAYRKRMSWTFRWVSSDESDFNYDFGASYKRADLDAGPVFHNFKVQKLNFEDQPGVSVFYKDEAGDIFHTYSLYERGGEHFIAAYDWLDIAPKGRNEDEVMDWMQRHDEYKD